MALGRRLLLLLLLSRYILKVQSTPPLFSEIEMNLYTLACKISTVTLSCNVDLYGQRGVRGAWAFVNFYIYIHKFGV